MLRVESARSHCATYKKADRRNTDLAVYLIGLVNAADPEKYQSLYVPGAQKIIAAVGGKPLVRAVSPPNKITVLEGNITPNRVSVLEFPSSAAVRAWYDSPEYADLKKLGLSIAQRTTVVLED